MGKTQEEIRKALLPSGEVFYLVDSVLTYRDWRGNVRGHDFGTRQKLEEFLRSHGYLPIRQGTDVTWKPNRPSDLDRMIDALRALDPR